MPTPPATTTATKPAKPTTTQLRIQNLVLASRKAEEALPAVVDSLVEEFHGTGSFAAVPGPRGGKGRTSKRPSAKERVMIARFLAGTAMHKDRIAEELGLNRPGDRQGGVPLTVILAGRVDFKALSAVEREDLYLRALRGDPELENRLKVGAPLLEGEIVKVETESGVHRGEDPDPEIERV